MRVSYFLSFFPCVLLVSCKSKRTLKPLPACPRLVWSPIYFSRRQYWASTVSRPIKRHCRWQMTVSPETRELWGLGRCTVKRSTWAWNAQLAIKEKAKKSRKNQKRKKKEERPLHVASFGLPPSFSLLNKAQKKKANVHKTKRDEPCGPNKTWVDKAGPQEKDEIKETD